MYRSPHHYNLILVGVIIVCADAGNSHIFREICRGDITLAKKKHKLSKYGKSFKIIKPNDVYMDIHYYILIIVYSHLFEIFHNKKSF